MAVALDAAAAAGEILRNKLPHPVTTEKSVNDLVTDADVAAQQIITDIVLRAFPDHAFLGEEDASLAPRAASDSPWQWMVDPIDGTTNYAHGLRGFCVSIALMHHGTAVVGVVYDPMAEETFTALAGRGAWLNRLPVAPSGCEGISRALIAASFPPSLQRHSPEISQFLEILMHCQSVRRLGSAALNLCYVAAGRLDAYWGGRLHAWDIAAAALIAQEAGASLMRHDGTAFDPWRGQVLAAATPNLAHAIVGHLQSVA